MKQKKIIILLICLLGITLILGNFLKDTAIYSFHSFRISWTEYEAKTGYLTENGHVPWDEGISAQFKWTKAEKATFIESSDTAKFLYHCGYSYTGKVVRILVIVFAIAGFIFTIGLFFETIKVFCKHIYRKIKRRLHRRNR